MKIRLKTPISYYGGKQKLAPIILDLIPQHTMYVEPFIGGGAIFFAKEPSEIEVLNDTNKELINFYRMAQNNFVDLEKLVRVSLHSRHLHRDASVIYHHPHLFTEVQRAWAVWASTAQSFSSIIDNSWGYDKRDNTTTKKISNKREGFTEDLAIRLQNVQLECTDAMYVISSRDTDHSFFYCDPPYPESNCGHYDGYTIEDFEMLLQLLSKVKGKFLLSSYPYPILTEYTERFGWHTRRFESKVSVNKGGNGKMKTEVLSANYPI
jgi:DNA adenine methylase